MSNSSTDNGISGYSNLNPTEKGNIITYSDTTTSTGIFYQPYDFIGYSHVQGLYPLRNNEKWNRRTLLYTVTLFKKSAGGQFDYANKFNRNKAKELLVKFPFSYDELNFSYMESFIKVVEKLVIKDVVIWADKKIEVTKKVIER